MYIDISTRGSSGQVTIQGTNFGTLGPALYIAGQLISVQSFSYSKISFVAPAGQGIDVSVVVDVSNQNATASFSYAAPTISYFSPTGLFGGSTGYIDGQKVTLQGSNFGK
jgi:hypothetical protein